MSIIKGLVLGFDITVGVLLIFFIFIGFLKGFRKNLRRFLSFFIPFILLVIFLNLICKTLLAFDISKYVNSGDFTSVKDYLINFITTSVYPEGVTSADQTEVYMLAEGLALGLVKFVVYIVGIILIAFIIAPILRIILWIIGKIVIGKKQKPLLISRLLGMGVGALRFIVFFIILILPIFGFISTISLALEDLTTVSTALDLDKFLNTSLNDVTEESYPTYFSLPNEEKKLLSKPTIKQNPALDIQGILGSITSKASQGAEELKNTTLLEMIDSFQTQYNSSVVKSLLNITKSKKTGLTVDCRYLGSLIMFKTEHGKVNFIKEYGNLRRIIPVVASKVTMVEKEDTKVPVFSFDTITEDDVNTICDVIKDIQVIKVIAPVAYEYGCYILDHTEDIDFTSLGIDVETIKAIDINKELDTVIEITGELVKAASKLKINLDDPISILGDPNLSSSAQGILNAITKLQVVDQIALPIASEKLTDMLKEVKEVDTSGLVTILTPASLKTCVKDDSVRLVEIVQDVYKLGVFDIKEGESFKIDVSTEENAKYIKDIIIKLFNISLIKTHEETLLRTLLSLDAIKEYVTADEIFDGSPINWEEEPTYIANMVVEALKLVGEGEIKPETFLDNKEKSYAIIEAVAGSDLVRKIGIMLLDKVISSTTSSEEPIIPQTVVDALNFDSLKALDKEGFINELKNLYEIIYNLREINVIFAPEGSEVDLSNKEVLNDLIVRAFNISLIKGNETSIFNYLLDNFGIREVLNENGLEINLETVDWTTESANLANVVTSLASLGDLSNLDFSTILDKDPETGVRDTTQVKKISDCLDALTNSQIFGPIVFTLIDKVISGIDESMNFNLTFTDPEKELIKTHTWFVEINKTLEVYDIVNEELINANDLTEIHGSTITNIMITSSQSVIASKVLGTILVESLGDNGFAILPKNEDGTYKYDFTNPTVLAAQAENIGNLVELANTMTNLTSETLSDNLTVEAFVEEFKKLDDNEIAKDMVGDLVKDYTGTEVDLSNVDFTEEADIFEEAMNEYQADPDNFDINSNPELKEKVEDSELAKAILEALGLL